MMRRLIAGSAGLLLILSACAGPDDGEETPPTPEPTTPSPTDGTDDVDQDDGGEDADGAAPDEGAGGDGDGDGDGTEDGAGEAARTDVPPDVMLSAEALGGAEPRDEDDAVVPWRLPEACEMAAPAAESMRTVVQGSGELEAQVGVHQTAVFADAGAATAAADELIAALNACEDAETESTAYLVEPIDVGAQGHGLITDFYGAIEGGEEVEAVMGTYLAMTRRGSAVTLVSAEGGEGIVDTTRVDVVERLGAAWDLLCGYTDEGC